jgi:hypothetical protein
VLYRHDEVIIAAALVVLLLLLETQGCPLAVIHDLLPLALRGVERHDDRFLTIGVVARDVRSSRVVRGMRCPSRWMRDVYVVSF